MKTKPKAKIKGKYPNGTEVAIQKEGERYWVKINGTPAGMPAATLREALALVKKFMKEIN